MRYNLVLIVFFLSIISSLTIAQSSNYLSYQAVVRNSSGELIVNKEINLKLSILQDSVNGRMAYSEIHQVLTDWKGNVSLKIGEGSVLDGIYTKINWAKTTFFIKTEIDFDGKQNFIFFGASQLISVPYALYAENTLNSLPGPKGLKGDKGDTGEQGATGPIGKINNQKLVLSKNRDSLIFDPLNSIKLPDLITHTNRSIGDKSAVSGGTIINAGIPLNSKKGICWSTNSLPTINDYTSYAAAASSDFKLNIDRLTSNTIYYVRAFVIHNNSVIYGQVESFKTFKSQFEISYQVVSDNNNDSKINKGEKIYLKVSIKNNGNVALKGVKALFSSIDKYVKNSDSTKLVSFGDISVNSSMDGNGGTSPNNYTYSISFDVSDTTPLNYFIPFNIKIMDANNAVWKASFDLNVVPTNANITYSSHNIAFDNNNDKKVNKGEKIYVQVLLKNIGTSKANGVKASFSTSSKYVTNFEPLVPISYSDINANGTSSGASQLAPNNYQYTIAYTVADTTPNGTKIPIDISMVDESKNKWTTQFELEVVPTNANITYASHSIAFDNNDDKKVNKGEKIYVQVLLKNTGTSKANGVKASFSTSSKYVTNFEPLVPISYSDINANGTSSGASQLAPNNYQYTIAFTVADTTPNGTKIPINISMIDESKNKWSAQFELEVEQTEANIVFVNYNVVLDDNKDGAVNKGEKVYLLVQLKNTGKSKANGLKVLFSSTNQYVSNLEPNSLVIYGDLMPNGVSSGTTKLAPNNYNYTVSFDVSNDLPTNVYPDIDLLIVDESKNQWSTNFKCFSLPQVQTLEVTSITKESAVSGGVIISDGGLPIIETGICWDTSPSPNVLTNKLICQLVDSTFTGVLSGLINNTTYYVRAYVKNILGTNYGNEMMFKSSLRIELGQVIKDIDGNNYKTVFIGSQQWMAENLKTSKYSDGSIIFSITNNSQWKIMSPVINYWDGSKWVVDNGGAYCYYNNDFANDDKYGKLYNWYAVSRTTNGNKNICPTGWHVPTDVEWTILTDYLGGESVAGGKMKEVGTTSWISPNKDATNISLFTGLPGGLRRPLGYYDNIGGSGYWWSSSESSTFDAWYRNLNYYSGDAYRGNDDKKDGFSVRCLRD